METEEPLQPDEETTNADVGDSASTEESAGEPDGNP